MAKRKKRVAKFSRRIPVYGLGGATEAASLFHGLGEGLGSSVEKKDEYGVTTSGNPGGGGFFTAGANVDTSINAFSEGDIATGLGTALLPGYAGEVRNDQAIEARNTEQTRERQESQKQYEREQQGFVSSGFEDIKPFEEQEAGIASSTVEGFKHGGDPSYAKYHNLPQKEYNEKVGINVEGSNGRDGGELEVSKGKVVTDYKSRPSHPSNEDEIDLFGNVMAKPGNVIVSKDKRKAYLEGDLTTRNTIEAQLRKDQRKREGEELQVARKGGGVSNKTSDIEPIPTLPTGLIPTQQPEGVPQRKPGYKDITVNGKPLHSIKDKKGVNSTKAKKEFKKKYGLDYDIIPSDLFEGSTFKHGGKVPRYEHGGRSEFQSGDSRAFDETFLDTQSGFTTDPDLPPTSNDSQRNKFGFSEAAQYAPALYNLGVGLFGDTPTADPIHNPRREEVAKLLREREVDFDPIQRDIDLSERTAEKSIRGTSRGNAGLYAAGRVALSNTTSRARSKARMEADLINQGYRKDEAAGLAQLGTQEAASEERTRRLNLAFQANQAQFIPKGIEQAASASARTENTRQGQDRNDILREEYGRRAKAAEAQGDAEMAAFWTSQLDQ